MTTLKSRFPLPILPIGVIITMLALLLPAFAQAAPLALPPRPPTPTQLPPATPTQTPPAQVPTVMASIELRVRFGSASAWSRGTMTRQDLRTVVQWQDKLGDWHAVDGWRGALDEFVGDEGREVWWVAEKDFSSGPFRWTVTDGKSNQPIAVSSSFNLPARSNARVIVEMMLEER
jgi:hypothetical protein